MLHLDSTVYEYRVTELSGDIRALGTSLGIGDGVPHRKSSPIYSTGDIHGPFFYLYSDGSEPSITVSPSPVSLQFFEIVNSSVDVSRPAPPLEAGDYWVSRGAEKLSLGPNGAFWDYAITFIVTPAP